LEKSDNDDKLLSVMDNSINTVKETSPVHKRLTYVDTCKFICIFLVMYAHARRNGDVISYLYSFHLPVFFFLNGLTLNIREDETLGSFLERKIKSYLIPIFFLGLMSITIDIGFRYGTHQEVSWKFFVDSLVGLYQQERMYPLWFVGALFVSDILFFLAYQAGKGKLIWTSLFSLLILTIAILFNKYFSSYNRKIMWNLDAALFGAFFVYLGWLFNHHQTIKIRSFLLKNRLWALLWGSILLALGLLLNWYNYQTYHLHLEMWGGQYQKYYLVIPSAILGSLGAYLISFALDNKILAYLGQSTLILLAFHQILANRLFQDYICKNWVNETFKLGENDYHIAFLALTETLFDLGIILPIYFLLAYTPLAFMIHKKIPSWWKEKYLQVKDKIRKRTDQA
jgi:fucose 4-O-acetylase-like acetyltransferase